ncbi:MAG: hypothetical protein WAN68_19510 [Pseudolabrys sp.]
MAELMNWKLTRRGLLKAGTVMTALPFLEMAAPNVLAQGVSKSPTQVLDFMTNADVAKAEQEGQLVFYCHENEPGTAGIMEASARTSRRSRQAMCARRPGRSITRFFRNARPGVSMST